ASSRPNANSTICAIPCSPRIASESFESCSRACLHASHSTGLPFVLDDTSRASKKGTNAANTENEANFGRKLSSIEKWQVARTTRWCASRTYSPRWCVSDTLQLESQMNPDMPECHALQLETVLNALGCLRGAAG